MAPLFVFVSFKEATERLSRTENDLITRTNNATPLNELMRRYWLPALLSSELPDHGAKPVQVRMLNEELVAWRLADGRVGLLQEHCSHRGSSLVYARSDGDCLRCVYHGRLYDAAGNVLDTPAEPARSVIKDKVKHPAYATHEAAGVIWAYLGPKDKQPLFPNYRFTEAPAENVYVTKVMMDCNWLQGVEGECDSAHVLLLHQRFDQVAAGRAITHDLAPEYETEETDFGLRPIALRKQNDPTQQYVRVSSFVMPCEVWVPVFNREIHFYVPIDDTHTWRFDLGYLQRAVTDADVNRASVIDERFNKTQHMGNGYAQSRQMMTDDNFSGIESVLIQDALVTETMDYSGIFDRTQERLGMSDVAIIALREYILRAVKAVQDGADPPHVVTDPALNDMAHVDAVQEVFAADEDWHKHWTSSTRRQLWTQGLDRRRSKGTASRSPLRRSTTRGRSTCTRRRRQGASPRRRLALRARLVVLTGAWMARTCTRTTACTRSRFA
jgi:phenylpropionate dioxygenase-like ring-hydroxylating dioxygenase large terminal subunit